MGALGVDGGNSGASADGGFGGEEKQATAAAGGGSGGSGNEPRWWERLHYKRGSRGKSRQQGQTSKKAWNATTLFSGGTSR